MTSYRPKSDEARSSFLKNLSGKLPVYADKFGITEAELLDLEKGTADWLYRNDCLNRTKAYAKALTAYKNALIDSDAARIEMPAQPMLPGQPETVAPGLFQRIGRMVQRIKAHNDYSIVDGTDLGIESTESTDMLTENSQPVIRVKTGHGGRPVIKWTKGESDGIAIYKDSGEGFKFFDIDTYPDYEDKSPLPAQPATWRYKVIYKVQDEEQGQFSDVHSLIVAAQV